MPKPGMSLGTYMLALLFWPVVGGAIAAYASAVSPDEIPMWFLVAEGGVVICLCLTLALVDWMMTRRW